MASSLRLVLGSAVLLWLQLESIQAQRDWVQWGPLRVYVVGRGRSNNNNLQQLRDDRGGGINSVQDILAQLDTAKIENSTLPFLSIALPAVNDSYAVDCITANNEPGQCKSVQECFINAFTTDGRIKNRALLERDVESSTVCSHRSYDAFVDRNSSAPFHGDIREKLICCEKPRVMEIMRIVNMTEIKSQNLKLQNMTMLDVVDTAVIPTSMTESELIQTLNETLGSSSNMSSFEVTPLPSISINTTAAQEDFPNFEALVATIMPKIMEMQNNETIDELMGMDPEDPVTYTMAMNYDIAQTTEPSPKAEALKHEALKLEETNVHTTHKHLIKSTDLVLNAEKTSVQDTFAYDYKKNASDLALEALRKKETPRKLCVIKPRLECAAKRKENYVRPENVQLKNKYAWMATLFVDRQMFCMGSLIDANHILTAAHCFPKNPSSMDFEKVKIGIGYNSDKPNITAPYAVRKVEKIIVHEGFNFKTLVNDIAIVKLESPAFNKTTLFDYDDVEDHEFPDPQPKPICFSEETEDVNVSFENQEAILSGWTIPRRRRKTMAQEISIRVWNNEECCSKYGDIPPAGITDEMMCAFTYGKNDCFSRYNTGAPLFIVSDKGKRVNAYNHSTPSYIQDRFEGDDEGDHVLFQVGILSWGYGCKDYPPVFTRVNPYFDWIEKNLAPEEE